MKFSPCLLIVTLCLARLHALESTEITALAKRFDNPVTDEQYQARMELNRIVAHATLPGKGDPVAVTKILVTALQSPDTSEEAAKYLMRSLARVGTTDAVGPLAKILAGDNAFLREEAREALSWIRDPKSVAALESALAKCSNHREEGGLISALATQKSANSVTVLAPFVLSPDLNVSRDAMNALANIGGAEAIGILRAAHANEKLGVALKPDVENALLVASPNDEKITNQIYQTTKSPQMRTAAFITLMQKKTTIETTALVEAALKSEDFSLRHLALAHGIEMNLPSLKSSITQSITQMPKDDRLVVLANLHYLKPAADAEKLALSCMASTDEDDRIASISALGKIGTREAFDAVLQALGAREPKINQAAVNALASMAFSEAADSLIAILKGNSVPEKILAIKALAVVHLPDAGTTLIQLIKGSDLGAAKEAMKTLYFISSMEDLRVLSSDATVASDPKLRKDLISISARIATRMNTPAAADLVKDLK
jgi:HEAT repeat protein